MRSSRASSAGGSSPGPVSPLVGIAPPSLGLGGSRGGSGGSNAGASSASAPSSPRAPPASGTSLPPDYVPVDHLYVEDPDTARELLHSARAASPLSMAATNAAAAAATAAAAAEAQQRQLQQQQQLLMQQQQQQQQPHAYHRGQPVLQTIMESSMSGESHSSGHGSSGGTGLQHDSSFSLLRIEDSVSVAPSEYSPSQSTFAAAAMAASPSALAAAATPTAASVPIAAVLPDFDKPDAAFHVPVFKYTRATALMVQPTVPSTSPPAVLPTSSPEPSMSSSSAGGASVSGRSARSSNSAHSSSNSSTASSTFSTLYHSWHRYQPSVFVLYAALLLLISGACCGIAMGALGVGRHSALVGLLRAGSGLDFHTVLISSFSHGMPAAACAEPEDAVEALLHNTDSGTSADTAGDDELLMVLEACEQAAADRLRYARIVQGIQAGLMLVCCPMVGRLSDAAGRQNFILLSLFLQVLPPLMLLLHTAAGMTSLVFLAAQCLTALCPLPVMLLIFLVDVLPGMGSGLGVTASGQSARDHQQSLSSVRMEDRRTAAAVRVSVGGGTGASGMSSTSGGPSSPMLAKSPTPSGSASASSSSVTAASRTVGVAGGGGATTASVRVRPTSFGRRVKACCFPGTSYSTAFHLGSVGAVWSAACFVALLLSTILASSSTAGITGADSICTGILLGLSSLCLILGLVIPESLVPFHRLPLPPAPAPPPSAADPLGATSGPPQSAPVWKLGFRVWRELCTHFSFVRHVLALSFLSALAQGWLASSLVPFLARHAIDGGDLFSATRGLTYTDVLYLMGSMMISAAFVLSLVMLVVARAELPFVRLLQALLIVLLASVLAAFALRVHELFSYACCALLGASFALVPVSVSFVGVHFDVTDKGKSVGLVGGVWGSGLLLGALMSGVAYDLIMEHSQASDADAAHLSFPQRLFVAPAAFAFFALIAALRTPASGGTVAERMAYLRQRPASENSQLRTVSRMSWSSFGPGAGGAGGTASTSNPLNNWSQQHHHSRSLSLSASRSGGMQSRSHDSGVLDDGEEVSQSHPSHHHRERERYVPPLVRIGEAAQAGPGSGTAQQRSSEAFEDSEDDDTGSATPVKGTLRGAPLPLRGGPDAAAVAAASAAPATADSRLGAVSPSHLRRNLRQTLL